MHNLFTLKLYRGPQLFMLHLSAKIYCKIQAETTGRALYQDNTFALELPGIGLHCLYMCAVTVVFFSMVIFFEVRLYLYNFSSHAYNTFYNIKY